MDTTQINSVITNYFDLLPFKVVIMDKNQVVVAANKKFEKMHGAWLDKKCYEVCKNSKIPCMRCQVQKVIQTGTIEIVQESSIDLKGKMNFDVVVFSPIYSSSGEIEFVQEISIPQHEVYHWENDFNVLFENSPNFITIVDRDLNILRSNRRMANTFSNLRGKKCYEVLKKRKQICNNCPTLNTFKDGTVHSAGQVGITSSGEKTHYIMTSAPVNYDAEGNVSKVMEIGIDITEINKLQEQLNFIHDFYGNLIENSSEGIIAIDRKGKLQIFNPAAEKIFNWTSKRKPGFAQARKMLPEQFFNDLNGEAGTIEYIRTNIKNIEDEDIPVQLKIFDIKTKNDIMGRVAIMTDLRPIIEVEENKQRAKELAFREKFATIGKDTQNILKNIKDFMGDLNESMSKDKDYQLQRQWNQFYDRSSEYLQIMNLFIKYAQGYNAKEQLIDLNQLVEDEFMKYKNTFSFSDLKMELHLSQDTPVISADWHSLKEAVYVIMLHYMTYIQENCANITYRTFFNDDRIFFEIEVKCKAVEIPDFNEGLSLSIITMISELNNIEIKTIKIKEENLIKISLIFQ
jgi:PAS domain S-box-containing protein